MFKQNNDEFVLLHSKSGDYEGLFVNQILIDEAHHVPITLISKHSILTQMIIKECFVINDEVEENGGFHGKLFDHHYH